MTPGPLILATQTSSLILASPLPPSPSRIPLSRHPATGGLAGPGCESPCPRCGKEAWRLQALHEAIVSIREAQQELHR